MYTAWIAVPVDLMNGQPPAVLWHRNPHPAEVPVVLADPVSRNASQASPRGYGARKHAEFEGGAGALYDRHQRKSRYRNGKDARKGWRVKRRKQRLASPKNQ